MTSPDNIAERHQEIQMLVADDEVPQAVKRLMDFVREFSKNKDDLNDIIVISASYNRLEKHERRGTLPTSEVEQQRNQLLYRALSLLDDIVEQISFNISNAA
jgi:phenylalanyl-tRNA synthetase alpha subunit